MLIVLGDESLGLFEREGQQAIRYLRACQPFRPYTPQQIGLGLWYVEGAHLDQCFGNPQLAALDRRAKLVDCVAAGFESTEQVVELKRVIKEKRELVNHARRRVLGDEGG